MNATQIADAVLEVQEIGDEILGTLKVVDPAVAIPAQVANTVLDLAGRLIAAALSAFEGASGTPITTESLRALLPNQTPLTAADA